MIKTIAGKSYQKVFVNDQMLLQDISTGREVPFVICDKEWNKSSIGKVY